MKEKVVLNKKFWVFFFACLFISLLIIVLLEIPFTFFLIITKCNDHGTSTSNKPSQYMYLKLNRASKKVSSGIVSLSSHLGENDYISYKDGVGNPILISPFLSDKYRCTGSCHCGGEHSNRKSATTSIVNGIMVLVTGITTAIVMNRARTHFNEECQEQFSVDFTCDENNIRSEVDNCENLDEETKTRTTTEEEEEINFDEEYETKRAFYCSGTCIDKIKPSSDPGDEDDERKCIDLKLEEFVEVSCVLMDKACVYSAKMLFLEKLRGFCKETSSRYSYVDYNGVEQIVEEERAKAMEKKKAFREFKKFSICMAGTIASNPSINCSPLYE